MVRSKMSDNNDQDTLFDAWNLNFAGDYDDCFLDEPQAKAKCGNQEGYHCVRCNDFFPYAEINQSNQTFKCWSCRNGLSTSQ